MASPEVLGSCGHGVDDDRTLLGTDDTDLVEVAGVVGSDEHGHALVEVVCPEWVVEGMEDRLV
jgi:hypothetical protein